MFLSSYNLIKARSLTSGETSSTAATYHSLQYFRHKTVHSQGNVGKVFWVDEGGHNYTGIFKGGDSGFVRLSSVFPVISEPPADFKLGFMLPSMALKFLRDGVDSANAFGNLNIIGQQSYNFFESSLFSRVRG